MACRHSDPPGTEVCQRTKNGNCRVNTANYWRATSKCANTPATNADAGQAGEHLVAFDLLRRGLKVTKPLNANGPDDLYAKASGRWHSVQVKLGRVHRGTGTLSPNPRSEKITSDVLAVVDAVGGRVRYIAKNIPELPKELNANS